MAKAGDASRSPSIDGHAAMDRGLEVDGIALTEFPPDATLPTMRLLTVMLAGLGVTACSLVRTVPTTTACPQALISGRLAPNTSGGALVMTEEGPQPVAWPEGYTVETEPDLVLRDARGDEVARAGDPIYVSGGMRRGDDHFFACGRVSHDPP